MLSQRRFLACQSLQLVWVLSACAGSATPQLIAAHPVDAIATYVPPGRGSVVIYDAYLGLRVANVGAAAAKAEELAYAYGGYVQVGQSWYGGEKPQVTLTLAVPVAAYDSLYGALLRLGTLEHERVTGSLVSPGDPDPWNYFSSITLHFSEAEPAWRWPTLPSLGWSPFSTFRAAFGVFAAIFTYLLDIVIWVTVVLGPFVLLGLGLRALVRRWRPRP